jgi:cytidyltransferase-like protein
MAKKVFVSGFFDFLHSGHVTFLQQAAVYGDLYVAVGSDQTLRAIKGRGPVNDQEERLFMVKAVAGVKEAFISSGSGLLDFQEEIKKIRPDIFVVNEDGNVPEKQALCAELGIEYRVLRREPRPGLVRRSSTGMSMENTIPYRIDLAGGWLDQPYVSKHYPGAVITISIEPTIEFNERSGMATSTRRKAVELWGSRLPSASYETVAKMLFCYDNPPGTQIVSGSQDTIGIVFPGANKSWYDGEYWPSEIISIQDEKTLQFIEQSLYLVPLGMRKDDYDVLANTCINPAAARQLSDVTECCWEAIMAHDRVGFGKYVRASFEAQTAMFPNMITPMVRELIERYQHRAIGWKLSGAGGGGYLTMVSEELIENAVRVFIRREAV